MNNSDKLSGTWKLVSSNYEVQSTGQTGPTMGDNPVGYVHFTPDRIFVVLAASAPPKPDAGALPGSLSYTGKYRVDGGSWTTDIDVASVPAWIGVPQKRDFAIDGDTLTVTTPWWEMPNFPERGLTRGVLTFVRAT